MKTALFPWGLLHFSPEYQRLDKLLICSRKEFQTTQKQGKKVEKEGWEICVVVAYDLDTCCHESIGHAEENEGAA